MSSVIQQELMGIIQRELNDPRITGLPSITRVEVAEDLSLADVYFTIMGPEAQQNMTLNALRHSAGMMRTKLTKSLNTRTTPFLQFHIDENLKKEIELLELLDKVARENRELDAKRAGGEGGEGGEGNDAAKDQEGNEDQGNRKE